MNPLENKDDPSIQEKVDYPKSSEKTYKQKISEENERVKKSLKNDPDVVSISDDSDVDGVGCVGLLKAAFDNVAYIKSGGGYVKNRVDYAMEKVVNNVEETPVYITDIKPDSSYSERLISNIEKYSGDVYVYDHHEWEDELVEEIEKVCDDIIIDNERCSSRILYDNLELKNYDNLVHLIEDHDLWIKEDERSSDLSDLAFIMDSLEFSDEIAKHGSDILEQEEMIKRIEEHRKEKESTIEYQVKKSRWYEIVFFEEGLCSWFKSSDNVNFDEDKVNRVVNVAMSYGSAYRSEVGNILCSGWNQEERLPEEEYEGEMSVGSADLAVIIKPYNKLSFRSTDDFPYCDKIASRFGGGGHKCSAGAKESLDLIDDMNEHWETRGEKIDKIVLDEIVSMIEETGLNRKT